MINTRYILHSADHYEYNEVAELARTFREELWGGNTNPTLLAQKLAGRKVSFPEAFSLYKDLILKILAIVPGVVFAQVYADLKTTPEQMVEQGREIASWHDRVIVKIPTTLPGLKARTLLRKEKIPVSNTLVFSQEQIFAVCLHERLVQAQFGPLQETHPSYILPFVGRLDEIGENGLDLVKNALTLTKQLSSPVVILETSVRSLSHMAAGIEAQITCITAPADIYKKWFGLSYEEKENALREKNNLAPIPPWQIPSQLMNINTLEEFDLAITKNQLDIRHDLTDKGLIKFAQDWQILLA